MKKRKDILFLCQYFHPEYVSSATLPYDTAEALGRAGFSVGVMCGYPKEYNREKKVPRKETVCQIDIHRLRYLNVKRTGKLGRMINFFSFSLAVLFHLGEFRKYRSIMVYSNPPILPWVAAFAAKIFQCKLVFVAYDLYPEIAIQTNVLRESGLVSRVMKHINKTVYRQVDRVVALGSEMKDYIVQHRPINAEKVCVIPNWYRDKGEFTRSLDVSNRFHQDYHDKFVVSYLGNMGTCQDMDTIMEAVRALKDDPRVMFLFAGHGNKKDELATRIREEHLTNARVYDFLHGKDYQDALAISNCAIVSLAPGITGLCVPSKSYAYLMSKIPVIIIMDDSDLLRETKEYGFGIAVKNGDVSAMVDGILRLAEDENLVQSMGEYARCIFLKKYETDICTQQYVSLLNALLNSNPEYE